MVKLAKKAQEQVHVKVTLLNIANAMARQTWSGRHSKAMAAGASSQANHVLQCASREGAMLGCAKQLSCSHVFCSIFTQS